MRILRVVPTLMLLVVGSTSFLLSYVALRDVSAKVDAAPDHLAWAVPICVDGGILAASATIWASSYRRAKRDPLAFLTVAVLLGTSVIINVSHAGSSPLAQWIAALPPLVLLACLEIVAAQHRATLEDTPAAPARPRPQLTPTATSSAKPVRVRASEPTPEPTSASTAPGTTLSLGEDVRARFSSHVDGGGGDRSLAARIAAQTGASVPYVRRVLKTAREEMATAAA